MSEILSEKFSSKNWKLYKELEIVQTAQLNQLFELLHLVHIYDHGFYELGRNVNNDVNENSPIGIIS